MKILIHKNWHYPFPFRIALPKWISRHKNTKMNRCFMFTESCLYDLHNDDQLDINKLFGFSIGWHHNTSFRFGWRPNLETRLIEIFSYEYHNGIRQKPRLIESININQYYEFKLFYCPKLELSGYKINKQDTIINAVKLKKKTGLGYTLGLYFGGNQKAPQDIIVYRNNK